MVVCKVITKKIGIVNKRLAVSRLSVSSCRSQRQKKYRICCKLQTCDSIHSIYTSTYFAKYLGTIMVILRLLCTCTLPGSNRPSSKCIEDQPCVTTSLKVRPTCLLCVTARETVPSPDQAQHSLPKQCTECPAERFRDDDDILTV